MERAALQTEITFGVTGMYGFCFKTTSEMQDISRCKRQLMPPIFVYLSESRLGKGILAQTCSQVYYTV